MVFYFSSILDIDAYLSYHIVVMVCYCNNSFLTIFTTILMIKKGLGLKMGLPLSAFGGNGPPLSQVPRLHSEKEFLDYMNSSPNDWFKPKRLSSLPISPPSGLTGLFKVPCGRPKILIALERGRSIIQGIKERDEKIAFWEAQLKNSKRLSSFGSECICREHIQKLKFPF